MQQQKSFILCFHLLFIFLICRPKDEGGLAIRDPYTINNAALLNLTWRLLTSQDQWVQLCRKRFLSDGKPKGHYVYSSVWTGLKNWVDVVYQHST